MEKPNLEQRVDLARQDIRYLAKEVGRLEAMVAHHRLAIVVIMISGALLMWSAR